MKKTKKDYVRHFVAYNMCYYSMKTEHIERIANIVVMCFMPVLIIYCDGTNFVCQEAKGLTHTKIALIIVVCAYATGALILPVLFKRSNRHKKSEKLLTNQGIHYIHIAAGVVLLALMIMYITHGLKALAITLLLVMFFTITAYFISKQLIMKIIKEDGFNEKKHTSIFYVFDSYNSNVVGTKWFAAIGLAFVAISAKGLMDLTILAIYYASFPVISMCWPVCCGMQKKYAREYDLQEYLPTKSIEEIEKEENKEEHRNKSRIKTNK